MKSGFLLDKTKEKGNGGILGDPRSTQMERYLNKGSGNTNKNAAAESTTTTSSTGSGWGWGDNTSEEINSSSWGNISATETNNNVDSGWGIGSATCENSNFSATTASTNKDEDNDTDVKEMEDKFKGMKWKPQVCEAPKLALTNWYSKYFKGNVVVTNKCFETRGNGQINNKLRFTSIFICPVSGNKFYPGIQITSHPSDYEIVTDDDNDNNKTKTLWFYKKKEAETAAAARALDCLNYMLEQQQDEGTQQNKVQLDGLEYRGYCYEEPEIPPLPFPPPGDSTSTKKNSDSTTTTGPMDCDNDNTKTASTGTAKPPILQPVMQLLNEWLRDNYRIQFQKSESYKYDSNDGPPHLLKWTATLTCPASGNVYTCGRLKDCITTLEVVNNNESTDIVWYKNKKDAEKAAAGKMMDHVKKFVDTNCFTNGYYCLDEPTTPPIYKYPPQRSKLPPPGAYVPVPSTSEQAKEDYVNTRGKGPQPVSV